MPLYRRLPKRGFKNRNSKDIVSINISALDKFEDGATVDVAALMAVSYTHLWHMVLNSIVIRVPTVHVLLLQKYLKEKECLDIWVA